MGLLSANQRAFFAASAYHRREQNVQDVPEYPKMSEVSYNVPECLQMSQDVNDFVTFVYISGHFATLVDISKHL